MARSLSKSLQNLVKTGHLHRIIIFLCLQVELWSWWRWRCLRAWVCSLLIKWQQYYQVLKVKNFCDNSAFQHKTPSPTQSALVWNHSPWQEALHGLASSALQKLFPVENTEVYPLFLCFFCFSSITIQNFFLMETLFIQHAVKAPVKDLTPSIPRELNLGALLWGSN